MHYYTVKDTAEYLAAWAAGDFDGFAESLENITSPGEQLIDALEDNGGDARGMVDGISDELRRLAEMTQASLFMVRKAIEMLLDPPAERFATRQEALDRLLPERPHVPSV